MHRSSLPWWRHTRKHALSVGPGAMAVGASLTVFEGRERIAIQSAQGRSSQSRSGVQLYVWRASAASMNSTSTLSSTISE